MQRRLTALVVLQAGSAILLVVLAFSALGRIVSHMRYTQRFILEPLVEIGLALEENGKLRERGARGEDPRRLVADIDRFAARYRASWQLSGSSNPDALRQLEELRSVGSTELVDEERRTVDALVAATRRLASDVAAGAAAGDLDRDLLDQRDALHRLNQINLRFGTIARDRSAAITHETYAAMAIVSVLAILGAALLGVRVRSAIVPRIKGLVAKVRRFQELGVNEPIADHGTDELAVLSHALDVGFAAIAARDRDRDHFLAVMAHELKTPLSNIRGFARAALDHPGRKDICDRAISVIARQSDRVVRLVEDLFLVSRAHAHTLPFEPRPMAFAPLVETVAGELRFAEANVALELDFEAAPPILGDRALLTQALWTMLSYALRRAGDAARCVRLRVSASASEISTLIEGFGLELSSAELVRLFEPFSSVEYERASDGAPRNVLGLYLCQEIAKIHGGGLHAFNEADGTPALRLTLPR